MQHGKWLWIGQMVVTAWKMKIQKTSPWFFNRFRILNYNRQTWLYIRRCYIICKKKHAAYYVYTSYIFKPTICIFCLFIYIYTIYIYHVNVTHTARLPSGWNSWGSTALQQCRSHRSDRFGSHPASWRLTNAGNVERWGWRYVYIYMCIYFSFIYIYTTNLRLYVLYLHNINKNQLWTYDIEIEIIVYIYICTYLFGVYYLVCVLGCFEDWLFGVSLGSWCLVCVQWFQAFDRCEYGYLDI